ncbi:pirin family protein [Flavobacterium undicola]|uniref:pirin family protein n=1 Tax=Flavobacterium undicola TaxID=1932779 RepID=UPI0013775D13|nr:hypothetical protein [Flavobacterium undicola]MBA0882182.1 hypothetical protein [Flavobacterium undicola]
MIKQNPAQIYLATARGQWQTQGYNCWSTFNFGNYQEESKKAFGSLFLFNYRIVAPKQTVTIVTQKDSLHYILPLYGGIQYQVKLIATEQIQQIVSNKGTTFELSNPFDENVSFLQISFNTNAFGLENDLAEFDFEKKNKLISLFKNNTASTYIAQFDGRKEAYYQLKNKENGIFVYIINGAFEFENRLLETGDALSLKEIEDVEWESLSENAMLLLIEIPLV